MTANLINTAQKACIFIIFFMVSSLSADTLYLRSGKTIHGKIINQTRTTVKIEVDGSVETHKKDAIKRIQYGPTPQELEAGRKEKEAKDQAREAERIKKEQEALELKRIEEEKQKQDAAAEQKRLEKERREQEAKADQERLKQSEAEKSRLKEAEKEKKRLAKEAEAKKFKRHYITAGYSTGNAVLNTYHTKITDDFNRMITMISHDNYAKETAPDSFGLPPLSKYTTDETRNKSITDNEKFTASEFHVNYSWNRFFINAARIQYKGGFDFSYLTDYKLYNSYAMPIRTESKNGIVQGSYSEINRENSQGDIGYMYFLSNKLESGIYASHSNFTGSGKASLTKSNGSKEPEKISILDQSDSFSDSGNGAGLLFLYKFKFPLSLEFKMGALQTNGSTEANFTESSASIYESFTLKFETSSLTTEGEFKIKYEFPAYHLSIFTAYNAMQRKSQILNTDMEITSAYNGQLQLWSVTFQDYLFLQNLIFPANYGNPVEHYESVRFGVEAKFSFL